MGQLIEPEHEFCEILNAFPNLKDRIEILFNVDENIKDGISIYDYFLNKGYEDEEIYLIISKLNTDINYYLKKGEFPSQRKIEIGHEQILLEEE